MFYRLGNYSALNFSIQNYGMRVHIEVLKLLPLLIVFNSKDFHITTVIIIFKENKYANQ